MLNIFILIKTDKHQEAFITIRMTNRFSQSSIRQFSAWNESFRVNIMNDWNWIKILAAQSFESYIRILWLNPIWNNQKERGKASIDIFCQLSIQTLIQILFKLKFSSKSWFLDTFLSHRQTIWIHKCLCTP
jgi:hypothetical protein